MKNSRGANEDDTEPLGSAGWAVFIGIFAAFIGVLWWAARKAAEGGAMP